MIKKIQSHYFHQLLALSLISLCSCTWSGIVVDSNTNAPIEGAVVVRSWSRVYGTAGGSSHEDGPISEAVSGADGKFTISSLKRISAYRIPIFLPPLIMGPIIEEEKPIIFKPGYKFLIINKKEEKIKLDKIPTLVSIRKKELNDVEGNYETDYYKSHLLLNVVRKEEEFLGINHFSTKNSGDRERNYKQEVRQRAGAMSPPLAVMVDGHELGEDDFRKWINTFKNNQNSVDAKALNNLIKYGDFASDFLIKSLHDDDWRIRREAAHILAYVNNSKVVDALIDALNDSNNQVVYYVVFAIGEQRDSRAINPLIRVFNNNDEEVRYRVADALRKIEDPRALNGLLAQLRDSSVKVKTHVVEALGTISDVQAVEAIINCWSDNDHEVRVTAAKIVSEMGPIAIEPLIAKTLSEDSYFRWRAAKALRAFQNAKSVSAVMALLNDDTSEVKWVAIDTLERLGIEMAIAPLSLLLNDADSGINDKADEALKRISSVRESWGRP